MWKDKGYDIKRRDSNSIHALPFWNLTQAHTPTKICSVDIGLVRAVLTPSQPRYLLILK